jgi:hypothetical protein
MNDRALFRLLFFAEILMQKDICGYLDSEWTLPDLNLPGK